MVYQVMIWHLSGCVIREMLIALARRRCKTVTLGAFICRLWLNTVISSRFFIYYGITGGGLGIKNSGSTRAIQFSAASTKQERKLLCRTNLFLSYVEVGCVCSVGLRELCALRQSAGVCESGPRDALRLGQSALNCG